MFAKIFIVVLVLVLAGCGDSRQQQYPAAVDRARVECAQRGSELQFVRASYTAHQYSIKLWCKDHASIEVVQDDRE